MCDSFVVLPPHSSGGTLFAKISDIDANLGFSLVRVPRRVHTPGELLRITHISIPQVETTYEYLSSGYNFVWGCEFGTNEYGLTIGDEAQVTTEMYKEKEDGILSMDFNRLALERARNCREAIDVITKLLEKYGQGGNGSIYGNNHLDGSFVIADPLEAWFLETAGRKWIATQVKTYDSLSNCLKAGTEWDIACASVEKVDWAKTYNHKTAWSFGGLRQKIIHSALDKAQGIISPKTAFDLLRSHGENFDIENQGEVPKYICLHAFPITGASTVLQGSNAWVVQHDSHGGNLIWTTVAAGICISIFKPVFPGVNLPEIIGPVPTYTYDPKTMWWKHELLHRRVLMDFNNLMPEIRDDFDQYESEYLEEAPRYLQASEKEKQGYMTYCFNKAAHAEDRWIEKLSRRTFSVSIPKYAALLNRINKEAGLDVFLGEAQKIIV